MCSQIVLFLCVFKFCMLCWKHFKIVISVKTKSQQMTNVHIKNWSKSKLKTGPSMLRNKIGPICNVENCVFCCFCFLGVFSSFCFLQGERDLQEKQNKKLDQFLTSRRANIGPIFNFTTYINSWINVYTCVYIYIYIHMLHSRPTIHLYHQNRVSPLPTFTPPLPRKTSK